MKNIKITSYLSKPTKKYLLEIPETATVLQLKEEISKFEKTSLEWISADLIILHHTIRYGELDDKTTVANSRIEDEHGIYAELRYKFDECPPREG